MMPVLIQVWIEGYIVTGNRSGARKVGNPIEAVDLIEACQKLYDDGVLGTQYPLEISAKGVPSVWGCDLYDNEMDARKSFG